jgi:hypothetical protein
MTRQIISGKTYNTATATEICDVNNGLSSRDFAFYTGRLYKTKKGAYFIDGRGGPMSMFSHNLGGNSWSGSEGIIVLTAEEALALAEEHARIETVEEHFADMIEEA